MACQDIIAAMATKGMGQLIDKTNMEVAAIKAARQPFYDALVAIGVASAFDNCTAAQIDSVIEAVWGGLQESMQQQALTDGQIPF